LRISKAGGRERLLSAQVHETGCRQSSRTGFHKKRPGSAASFPPPPPPAFRPPVRPSVRPPFLTLLLAPAGSRLQGNISNAPVPVEISLRGLWPSLPSPAPRSFSLPERIKFLRKREEKEKKRKETAGRKNAQVCTLREFVRVQVQVRYGRAVWKMKESRRRSLFPPPSLSLSLSASLTRAGKLSPSGSCEFVEKGGGNRARSSGARNQLRDRRGGEDSRASTRARRRGTQRAVLFRSLVTQQRFATTTEFRRFDGLFRIRLRPAVSRTRVRYKRAERRERGRNDY